MRRYVLAPLLLLSVLLLTGCLFAVNHPRLAPDGTMAVFLESDGGYTLFPETGVLHLLRNGEWIAVPQATLGETGGLFDLSPDGTEALYVELGSEGLFERVRSTLYRVALQPAAVPEPVWETEDTIVRAVWNDDGRILLLLFGDEELGALHELDPITGETERLAGDLLSFAELPGQDASILLVVDRSESVSIGSVVRWNPETDSREALASFVLSDETLETYAMLAHNFLWDVSPDGTWVAICLADSTLIDPVMDSEVPSLYLIDVVGAGAERIAANGMMPAFSPDGTGLIYAVETEGDLALLMWRDLASDRAVVIPGTEGVSTAFWLSPSRLGMTFELDEDRYRLVELDLTTETIHDLLAPSPGSPD